MTARSPLELRRLIQDDWHARKPDPGLAGKAATMTAAEGAVAVFRSVFNSALGMGRELPRCVPDCVLGCEGAGFSLMFWAVAAQVRAVREFVRLALRDHPAAADAVAVASELAANSVAHSGSGLASGGMFTVHVMAMGRSAVGLAVTELRGAGFPQIQELGPDADCGRGLHVVEALTSLFWWLDDGLTRMLFATVPAPGGEP